MKQYINKAKNDKAPKKKKKKPVKIKGYLASKKDNEACLS